MQFQREQIKKVNISKQKSFHTDLRQQTYLTVKTRAQTESSTTAEVKQRLYDTTQERLLKHSQSSKCKSSSTSLLSIMWMCLMSQLQESSSVWPTMPLCCQQTIAPSWLLRSAAFMKHEGLGRNAQRWMSSRGSANRVLSVFTSNPFWPKFLTVRQDPPLTPKNDGEPWGTAEEISFSKRPDTRHVLVSL